MNFYRKHPVEPSDEPNSILKWNLMVGISLLGLQPHLYAIQHYVAPCSISFHLHCTHLVMCSCTVIQETLFASNSQQEFLSDKSSNEVSHALSVQAPSRLCINEFQVYIIAQAHFSYHATKLQNALKQKYLVLKFVFSIT